jgi:predicted nucleic acid-binding protein
LATPLKQYTGSAIYIDTILPYMLLRGVPESLPFFERIERGEFRAFTSVLTFDELAYRLILAFVKDRYGGSPLDRLRDEEEKIMTEFAPVVTSLLDRLRGLANLTIVNILAADLIGMNDAMTQFHVRPRDALHYVAMRRTGCNDLGSNDSHFDRIPGVKRYVL